jgi:hypothetical protein
MSNSYINVLDDIILNPYSYTDVDTSDTLDFSDTEDSDLQKNYFNISPKVKKAVYDNLIAELTECIKTIVPSENYESALSYELNSEVFNSYKYSNSVYSNDYSITNYSYIDNNYLLKFEDIIGIIDSTAVSLTEDTNINTFIKSLDSDSKSYTNIAINSLSKYNGAFLYPDLDSISQVLINDESNLLIKSGESVEIPITFEFFIDSNSFDRNNIKKSIVFAIKDSLYDDEKYFEVEIAGNANSTISNSIYSSVNNLSLESSLNNDLI